MSSLMLPNLSEIRKLIRERPDSIRRDGLLIETRRNLRDFQHDEKRIVGYAAVFNSFSEDLGFFVERIAESAFDKDLANGSDVRALNNHDTGQILGRRSAGTLRLSKDSVGLAVEIDIPDVSYGRDLRVSMARGDVTQMSFGFLVRENGDTFEKHIFDKNKPDEWGYLRTLLDVELIEVSTVGFPAYRATSAYLRSGFQRLMPDRLAAMKRRDRDIEILRLLRA